MRKLISTINMVLYHLPLTLGFQALETVNLLQSFTESLKTYA